MQDQTKHISGARERPLERAIVLQILRDDHDGDWLRAELASELGPADPLAVRNALTRLQDEGVVACTGETIRVSRAVMRLNELGVIAV